MSRNTDVSIVGATQIIIGVSGIMQVSGISSQVGSFIKRLSGGSLEIVNCPPAFGISALAGGLTLLSGSSAIGWGSGYLFASGEAVSIGGAANFYLAATGATVIVGYGTLFGS